VILQACLNGARPVGSHPRLPATPAELGRDAAACVAAGAAALHLHVRNGDGRETLACGAVNAVLRAVRTAAPGVEVSLSTGLWITGGDPDARATLVAGWRELPDSASVNVGEAGWAALCRQLAERGVGVEAGVATVEAAEALAASGVAPLCVRVLVEPEDEEGGAAIVTATGIDRVLGQAGVRLPRLHHGLDTTTWTVLDAAVPAGRDIRIGLEDTFLLPDGRPAAGNAELVAAAAARYRVA
jgi:uncharacterized protein (DUF849 family)